MASNRNFGGDEPQAKRLKLTSKVAEKVAIVQDAVRNAHGRFEDCQLMLESMTPGSLGPGLDERDELQEEAVGMMERVLTDLKKAAEALVDRKDAIVNDPEGTKVIMNKEFGDAKVKFDGAMEDEATKLETLKAAAQASKDAQNKLEAAKAVLAAAKKKLEDGNSERDSFEDAYTKHFVPLRDGTFSSKAEAMAHVKALTPLFKKFDYEESLIAAFAPSAPIVPDERKHFDKVTMVEVERGFLAHKDDLTVQIGIAETELKQAEQNVEDSTSDSITELREAALAYGRAKVDTRRAKLDLDDANEAMRIFPATPAQAAQQLEASKKALQRFEAGPWAAFIWLKRRVQAMEPYAW